MAKILMVASEATPFAKTGGLADVMGVLPQALNARGEEVGVVIPRYRGVALEGATRVYADLTIWLGLAAWKTDIYRAESGGVAYYLVDCPALYDREGLYGDADGDYPDNHVRFAVLSQAALAVVRHVWRPDILHCHDWQSALVPVFMRQFFAADPTFMGLRVLVTIHNLGYQGRFPAAIIPEIGLGPEVLEPETMGFFGQVNLMKGALVFADAISTVSKAYAREIQGEEFGFDLQSILRARSSVLCGILNGVDYTAWNPETDAFIAAHYSADDLAGKEACKRDLLGEAGLPEENLDRPLVGIISRFINQKGFDLIAEIAAALAGEDLALIALGTGEPLYEQMFQDLAAAHPDRFAVRIAYDNPLAHKIEAGADMFLMPSWFEPCGLNQMYSLRYGTVPLVRAVGGLDDTIDETTGFKFCEYSGDALLETIQAALEAWQDREAWRSMMRRGMRKDYGWDASAAEYSALYRRLVG
jgi:starch synthase